MPITWDPAQKNSQITLSNGNLTAIGNSVLSDGVNFPAQPSGWATPGFWGPPGFVLPHQGTTPSYGPTCR